MTCYCMENMINLLAETKEKNRLIVILTDDLAGDLQLAHKIHWMAIRDKRDVIYLTLVESEDHWLATSRYMATMKAATCSEQINTTVKLIKRDAWLKILTETYSPGDIVICQDEQYVSTGFLRLIPMRELLKNMKIPGRSIAGFYHPWRVQINQWFYNILFWSGCLITLALFSYLEIQIDKTTEGLVRLILWFIAINFEFGALLAWNRYLRS
jgi:hypothetical protein